MAVRIVDRGDRGVYQRTEAENIVKQLSKSDRRVALQTVKASARRTVMNQTSEPVDSLGAEGDSEAMLQRRDEVKVEANLHFSGDLHIYTRPPG